MRVHTQQGLAAGGNHNQGALQGTGEARLARPWTDRSKITVFRIQSPPPLQPPNNHRKLVRFRVCLTLPTAESTICNLESSLKSIYRSTGQHACCGPPACLGSPTQLCVRQRPFLVAPISPAAESLCVRRLCGVAVALCQGGCLFLLLSIVAAHAESLSPRGCPPWSSLEGPSKLTCSL